MKKHLKYIDESSRKFWEIETSGKKFTVKFGKEGSSGTSQTKEFESDEECEIAAAKLVLEKEKKGYSESGEPVALSPKMESKKQDLKAIQDEFHDIIRNEKIDELIPFLQHRIKGVLKEFRKHLNEVRDYWLLTIDLTKEPEFLAGRNYKGGSRASGMMEPMLLVTALRVMEEKQLRPWLIYFPRSFSSKAGSDLLMKVLLEVKPESLGETLLSLATARGSGFVMRYHDLCRLEQESAITFLPQLTAMSLANFAGVYNSWEPGKGEDCFEFIAQSQQTLQRDIYELFHYETIIHMIGRWRIDQKERIWQDYFQKLLELGLIRRDLVLENCLLIQTKEWNNQLKTFFKELYILLKPQKEEIIRNQNIIFHGVQNSATHVANFSLDLCKEIYELPEFNANEFLEWTSPLLVRSDLKSGLKTVMLIYDKLAKINTDIRPSVCLAVCDVFAVSDTDLQERAFKLISKYGDPTNEELKDKLGNYFGLMQGDLMVRVKSLLGEQIESSAAYEPELYVYQVSHPEVLLEEIRLPQTWNDILFHYGKYVESNDPIDYEILWNVFATQRHLLPANYKSDLEPYLNHNSSNAIDGVYGAATRIFLRAKMEDLKKPFNILEYKHVNYAETKLEVLKTGLILLNEVDKRIQRDINLPLLSFPTHYPYYVEPRRLLERMIQYEQAKEEIHTVDLALAICRMPREKVEQAIPLLDQIQKDFRPLMSYCLGVTDKIELENKSFFGKLFGKFNKDELSDKLTYLWAVAARTYYPESLHEEFASTAIADLPNVVAPFKPGLKMEEEWIEYKHPTTSEITRYSHGIQLKLQLPKEKTVAPELLYSLDLFQQPWKYNWESRVSGEGMIKCYQCHSPAYTDRGAIVLLNYCGRADVLVSAEVQEQLRMMLQPDYRVGYYSVVLLACCMFFDKKEPRMLASEVLYQLVERNSLDAISFGEKAAWLISEDYGVFQRFSEGILGMKDSSPKHNSAVFMIIDKVISGLFFKSNLPNHFKKFLENFYDLKVKTQQSLSLNTKQKLAQWKETPSLKKVIEQLEA